MDLETLDMLRSSLRHLLTAESSQPLAQRLDELGWDDVVADDQATALRTLFTVKGETLSSADALGPQLGRALARATGDDSLASASIVLPFASLARIGTSGELVVRGMLTTRPDSFGTLVFPVATDLGIALAAVPAGDIEFADGNGNGHSQGHGTDPDLGLVQVRGSVAVADLRRIGDESDGLWETLVARGRWLLAAELVGIGRHVLAEAAAYTGERVQYGKKIGTFQALQHRVASAHALVVGAGHLVDEASESDDPWHALVAKCLAGQAAENACTQAQQCYGAIGFTWEHEFHRYLRRTYVLDTLLGSWRALEFEIGTTLQRTKHVPHIGTL